MQQNQENEMKFRRNVNGLAGEAAANQYEIVYNDRIILFIFIFDFYSFWRFIRNFEKSRVILFFVILIVFAVTVFGFNSY